VRWGEQMHKMRTHGYRFLLCTIIPILFASKCARGENPPPLFDKDGLLNRQAFVVETNVSEQSFGELSSEQGIIGLIAEVPDYMSKVVSLRDDVACERQLELLLALQERYAQETTLEGQTAALVLNYSIAYTISTRLEMKYNGTEPELRKEWAEAMASGPEGAELVTRMMAQANRVSYLAVIRKSAALTPSVQHIIELLDDAETLPEGLTVDSPDDDVAQVAFQYATSLEMRPNRSRRPFQYPVASLPAEVNDYDEWYNALWAASVPTDELLRKRDGIALLVWWLRVDYLSKSVALMSAVYEEHGLVYLGYALYFDDHKAEKLPTPAIMGTPVDASMFKHFLDAIERFDKSYDLRGTTASQDRVEPNHRVPPGNSTDD